ncbi:MAG: hypothetical protein H6858_06690 [Rhodospirillales bacterium]|nr:hypothetical protein [Alphaproteobacteria bacterium]MCB9977266.1 hypothetical protein [Rhodospirillales bacterium]
MLAVLTGRLRESWSSITADEQLEDLQAEIDAAQAEFNQWAVRAEAAYQAAVQSPNGSGSSYDSEEALRLAEGVRRVMTEKGTSFELERRKHSILMPKGMPIPDVSLRTLDHIAKGLDDVNRRFTVSYDATEERQGALTRARESYAHLLGTFRGIVDRSDEALQLPSIQGAQSDDASSPSHKVRAHVRMKQTYTFGAHRSFIDRSAKKAGVAPDAIPAVSPAMAAGGAEHDHDGYIM